MRVGSAEGAVNRCNVEGTVRRRSLEGVVRRCSAEEAVRRCNTEGAVRRCSNYQRTTPIPTFQGGPVGVDERGDRRLFLGVQ